MPDTSNEIKTFLSDPCLGVWFEHREHAVWVYTVYLATRYPRVYKCVVVDTDVLRSPAQPGIVHEKSLEENFLVCPEKPNFSQDLRECVDSQIANIKAGENLYG